MPRNQPAVNAYAKAKDMKQPLEPAKASSHNPSFTRHMEDAMKDRPGTQYLGPVDLALLQACFDLIIERYALPRDSDQANLVATKLMDAYSQGVTDRRELMRTADPSSST